MITIHLQVYKVKLQRVQMKNSARVSCAHLLKSPSTAEQSLFCKLVIQFMETLNFCCTLERVYYEVNFKAHTSNTTCHSCHCNPISSLEIIKTILPEHILCKHVLIFLTELSYILGRESLAPNISCAEVGQGLRLYFSPYFYLTQSNRTTKK